MARLWKGLVMTGGLLGVLWCAVPAQAQTITTGRLAGIVEDEQGGVLPGVTVVAVHTETGTTYQAVTQTNGRYSLLNVRVGLYTVKATLSGFKDKQEKDVLVNLAEERAVDFKLQLAARSEEVTVTAESEVINTSEAGTAGRIGSQLKEVLPTINRSINDLARTNIYFNPMGLNDDPVVPAVAGRSQRYNTLQIDGAVNNDLFGLAASGGAPGGNAGSQPISLEAVRELQLVVSPYDVRQGGFSGGGINAITKSGTNQLHGTGYYYGRNQSMVGEGITHTPVGPFSDKQGGVSVGGPIVKDKAFFFGNFELGRRTTGSGFSIAGTGQQFGQQAQVDRMLADLKTLYGYDLGSNAKDEFGRTTNNNKVFVRADFNLSPRNQLTVRHNYLDALNDLGFPSSTTYLLPDAFYRYFSNVNSTVGQLTTRFGLGVNEFRMTYTRVRDHREGQPTTPSIFPFVNVTVSPGFNVRAGLENFSGANAINQDMFEINDDYTMVKGAHTITLGTHNEFFKFTDLFIRDFYGNYSFASLDTFEQGLAQSYDHSFSNSSDPLQTPKFRVNQLGFYIGDQWRPRSNLTATLGLRIDNPHYPDKPAANPAAVANFGYATDVVPHGVQWSPRAGFNWDRKGDASEQIRGGIGLFTGRPAYVWIMNQFGNTGIDFTRLTVSFNNNNKIPFVADPNNQPKSISGVNVATNEIDVIDPNFKYPSILRGNLAYDRKLPWGIIGTVEYLWSEDVNAIKYQNLNLAQSGTSNLDGRPIYTRKVSSLSNVLLLTNSDQGHSWTLSFEARRPFQNGLFVSAAYLYGRAFSVMDGTRDQAISMWNSIYVPGDPNNPPLTVSDYDPGHRINITATYTFKLPKALTGTATLFYSGESGRPYTLSYSRDVNGDAQGFNDNYYVPSSATQVTLTGGTYQDLLNFLNTDSCMSSQIGQIFTRNSCRAPWNNTLDGHFVVGVPINRVKAEVVFDALNMINMFSSTHGIFQYANFNQITVFQPTVTSGQVTSVNIAPLTTAGFNPWTRGDLRSRWQLQIGFRLIF